MTASTNFTAMESVVLVAPVTALEFLGEEYLLAGEGPVLSVYSVQSPEKPSVSLHVLHHYRIHGIRPRLQQENVNTVEGDAAAAETSSQDKETELAVFGGKGIRLIRLSPGGRSLHPVGPLVELQDWALDVRWLGGKPCSLLGVSLAHNAVLLLELESGNAVSLCSCEEVCLLYSALLIGPCWDTAVLVGGTVFNQLVLWRPGRTEQNGQSQVERRLLGHSGVIFSLAYHRHCGWLASASDDRSVRVWSVGKLGGEWGCGEQSPTCLRVLYGHQARVFCVRLAQGRVYSAGEDGVCLLWAWEGEGRVGRRFRGHRAGGVRALAISEVGAGRGSWVATGGADGGVRLWREREEEESEKSEGNALVDLKFNGTGCPKVVRVVGVGEGVLGGVVICTDQGEVYLHQDGCWQVVWQGGPEFHSYCVMEVHFVRERGMGFGEWMCAVGNLTGGVQVFPLRQPSAGILLKAKQGKVHSLQWVVVQHASYLLASGAEGCVCRWRIGLELSESRTVLQAQPQRPFLLPPCAKRWLTAAVCLPHRGGLFWVCGDRRGSLLLYREEAGGKGTEESCGEGEIKSDNKVAVNMLSRNAPLQPISSLFGIHGKQGVTCVRERQGAFYSAGRDGCVRVVTISKGTLKIRRVQRPCRGMEWLENVLFSDSNGPDLPRGNLEASEREKKNEGGAKTGVLTGQDGEGCDKEWTNEENRGEEKKGRRGGDEGEGNQERVDEARFVMVGFHSVNFMVWDPQNQEKLLSVPCGGGHRSWAYSPLPDTSTDFHTDPKANSSAIGQGALVFIKQGSVMASHSPTGKTAGQSGLTLREGLHGRGVGCVCLVGSVAGDRGVSEQWDILVTGGEDTVLTVLAIEPQSGRVKVLALITDHISSVRTLTAIRRGGPGSDEQTTSFSCLLFSAGGRAQLQCYRLLIGFDEKFGRPMCQVTQIAGHRLDEQWERKRNRHKTVKMDPETRYMSMAVVRDGKNEVVLALACSDGAVRLFAVNESTGRIELVWENFYHQRCVLSIAHCWVGDHHGKRYALLFSSATDGSIALWDLTSVLNSENKDSWQGPSAPYFLVSVHQSGVNTLAVSEIEGAGQRDEAVVCVASGGDDGQLSALTVKLQFSKQEIEDNSVHLSAQLLSQWSVPLAHSAPVTAVHMISPTLLVSTSPDQRVCLWGVSDRGIHHRGAVFSHTADAAGLQAWLGRGPEGGAWTVVCGQGLQLLRLSDGKTEERSETDKRSKGTERMKVNLTGLYVRT
ncbi:tRNA (34-2'-O)-methyltransferase regulator WDR6 [Chanos chanos]|uniref:tRNA (34-2'-O)-methyltransferase regulator WDR6 n=1 Tax=Chanos chanos TaxID=29144 RepID=A0A6J2W3T8_CHACN|nr:WD repeat-containing protein 6 [Chanos chanos]